METEAPEIEELPELQEEAIPYDPSNLAQRTKLAELVAEKMRADPDYQLKVQAEIWTMLYGFDMAVIEFHKMGPAGLLKMLTGRKGKVKG